MQRWLTRKNRNTEQASARRVLWTGRIMLGVLTVILLALIARVWQLEQYPQEKISALVGSQLSHVKLEARRGQIIGRRGRILASTNVAHLMFVDPKLIKDHSTFAGRVGYTFGIPPAHISKLLYQHPHSRFIVLARPMTSAQYAKFLKIKSNPAFSGLAVKKMLVRNYPQGPLAGQVIGFSGRSGKGLAGLELEFNQLLSAKPSRLSLLRDRHRRALWITPGSYKPGTGGRDLRVTLDMTIQAIAQKALADAVKKFKARSGQLIVMNPHTGAILAMANVPVFNPNDINGTTAKIRKNACVTNVFEPGSIFKPVVWSSLTQLGAAKPSEIINCTSNGVWITDFGRRLRDAEANGKITWEKVLIDSSNIGMAKVALRVSIPTLYHIIKRFGFGNTTGSHLPGEVKGLVNPMDQWTKYSQTSIPMGQEIAVTPLQIIRSFCVFANGGLLVRPRITPVGELNDFSGAVIKTRVISPSIAMLTRSVLRKVVTQGTGRRAKSKKYKIFGKTGTAQAVNHKKGGYFQHQYVSSFIGGAPFDDPKIVVGCFVQRPDPSIGHYGSQVSAPAVKSVITKTLTYLGVPQSKSSEKIQMARR